MNKLIDFKLYVIIDGKSSKGRSLVYVARQAIAGGADVIQLRHKEASSKELMKLGRQLRSLTRKEKIIFIVNDRVDIAYGVDADGVHLGQDDLPLEIARSILGKKKFIGISTHSLPQALKAQEKGADYIGVGPVFSTPTKPDYRVIGTTLIEEMEDRINIPFVAIGGIDETNIGEVIASGARRVAVVRAVCAANDIKAAAKRLKGRLKNV